MNRNSKHLFVTGCFINCSFSLFGAEKLVGLTEIEAETQGSANG